MAGTRPAYCTNKIALISSNINGWIGLSQDPKSREYLSFKDTVLIQETWVQEKVSINGFHSHSISTTSRVGHGRCKGGLGVLIATSLCVNSRLLPSFKQHAMAILAHFEQWDLLIINVYLLIKRRNHRLWQYGQNLKLM